ncbi:MAG: RodZ domain-containing protein [Terriglobia bacterium]
MTHSEEPQLTGFGEYLRRERELRGVTLDEISSATRISIRFLEAIENEELSKLPGGIFTRSFVKSYARFLGLDEERVLTDCQLAGRQRPEVDIRRITANRAHQNDAALRTRVIGLVVAAVLLASGYALFRHSRRVREQRVSTPIVVPPSTPATTTANPPVSPSTTTSPPANVPASQPSTSAQPEGNRVETPSGTPPAGATTPATPQGAPLSSAAKAKAVGPSVTSQTPPAAPGLSDLALQVAATERAWVAVDADGKTVLQKVLNPNEVENLKAHESFDVTVGNASGIVLTLDGVALKPLGRRGEVKSVHLTRQDVKKAAP